MPKTSTAVDVLPMPDAQRTTPSEAECGILDMTMKAGPPGPDPAGEGSEAADEAPAAPLDFASTNELAVGRFVNGPGASVGSAVGNTVLEQVTVGVFLLQDSRTRAAAAIISGPTGCCQCPTV